MDFPDLTFDKPYFMMAFRIALLTGRMSAVMQCLRTPYIENMLQMYCTIRSGHIQTILDIYYSFFDMHRIPAAPNALTAFL